MVGQTISHYHVVEELGRGGMGVVYKAEDTRLGRLVALKFLPPDLARDRESLERFQREARAAGSLNHPHICTIYDIDDHHGEPFLAMELLVGMTLKHHISGRPMAGERVANVGIQIAAALESAHAKGIVHRDIKPANIFLADGDQVKVLDFGLAKLLRPVTELTATGGLTQPGIAAGTLPYMAPEQVRGEKVDARTDIYALGAVLYEMATGRAAFPETQTGQLVDAILHAAPVLPSRLHPRLSPDLERIIAKCLEKDPERRYQSAKEVAVDLRRLAQSASTPIATPSPPRSRRAAFLAAGISALVLLGLWFGFFSTLWRELLSGGSTRAPIRSLAVLPLSNLSGDPAQDYFADGMTEALISDLAQISALKAISRTSVMQYKGTRKSLPQIGRELGVEAVIEGSVLRVGNRVRITAQLIESATDRHLWAQSYDRDVRDVLALQDEVSEAIASQVQARLTPQEQVRLTSARQVNPEAHELYLKGRYQANKVTVEGSWKAVEYFQKALELDPNDALAYASLADAYCTLAVFGGLPPKEAFPKAKALVTKALALDDSLAYSHNVSAVLKRDYEWDWEGAEKEFQRALELNPNSADTRDMYAIYLVFMRRFDEALREIRHAQSLDPLNLDASNNVGFIHFAMGHHDRAVEAYQRTIDLDANFVMAHRELGLVYSHQSLHPQAIRELERAVALSRDPYTLAMLGHAYAAAGRHQDALKILQELKARSRHGFVAAYYFADIYAGLRQKDLAVHWLEKAYQERDPALLWTVVDPRYDWLRSDPRFQDLLRRIRLPQ
jgi:serine/threonine-protein kinase